MFLNILLQTRLQGACNRGNCPFMPSENKQNLIDCIAIIGQTVDNCYAKKRNLIARRVFETNLSMKASF